MARVTSVVGLALSVISACQGVSAPENDVVKTRDEPILPDSVSDSDEPPAIGVPDPPVPDGGSSGAAGCDEARLDPAIVAGIRRALSLDDLASLTAVQLEQVTRVNASDASSLDGMGCLPNLRSLTLRKSTVQDLSPLADCPKLRLLDIESPELSDIASLELNLELEALLLHSTSVTDLSPLASLPAFDTLTLWKGAPPDLSPLAAIATLRVIRLEYIPIEDLSPALGSNQLEYLMVRSTRVSDLKPLVDWSHSPVRLELLDNPLSEESLTVHIPTLLEAGWCVHWTVEEHQVMQEPLGCFSTR